MKTWRIELTPSAEKQYLRLGKKMRQRVKRTLLEFEQQESPLLHPGVRALTGQLKGDYRIRLGKWRVLFTPDKDDKLIRVYAILPRGDAY